MSPAAPVSNARNELWLPPLALAGCLRAGLLRDTRDAELSAAQRHNNFPATPLVTLNWWFTGRSDVVLAGDGRSAPLAVDPIPGAFVFGGPFTRPTLSYNAGPVHGMILMLWPDAAQALLGVQLDRYVNRLVDAREVLPASWLAFGHDVAAASNDAARWQRIEAFFCAAWTGAAASGHDAASRYRHWADALALRAARSAAGRSLRQVERRIKQWAGLPMRELRLYSQAELAFFDALAARCPGSRIDWAGVAAEAGYADQSHLCRVSRRITGLSPAELSERIATDETFWAYRLWQ